MTKKKTLVGLQILALGWVAWVTYWGWCSCHTIEPESSFDSFQVQYKEVQGDVRQVLVVGGGVAGLSAGIYTGRAGIDTLVVAEGSGELAMTANIQNYPGAPPMTGIELIAQMSRQATGMGTVILQATVTAVDTASYPFRVTLSNGSSLYSYSVILASGASPRWPKLPDELKYTGRYIHSCPLCDGALYSDKPVVVLGGGESAVEAALYLSKIASRVSLLHRRSEWRASETALRKLPSNVELLKGIKLLRWVGSDVLEGIEIQRGGQTVKVSAAGAFVAIGSEPSTGYLTGTQVRLTPSRHIKVNDGVFTTVQGVFAAGEVADGKYRQAATAASTGVIAAIEVEKWLSAIGQCKAASAPRPTLPANERASHTSFEIDCEDVAKTCLDTFIQAHDVVIFSKTYCPYCATAKQMVASLNIADVAVIELDTSPKGKDVHEVLKKKTGRRTVPNIFVQGKNIGGSEELAKELPFLELTLKKKAA